MILPVCLGGGGGGGGEIAQSVERATPGEEDLGFDFRCGRPLPTGWVGVSIMRLAETEVMVFLLCLVCGSTYNCQTLCLGARLRHSIVVDEDVKKPTKQTNKYQCFSIDL